MAQAPWLDHYDEGVPTSLEPYPELTLVDYLAATARDEPAHTVVLYKGSSMSAARLERSSNAFAAALVDLGIQRGDRVALLLPNCPQFLVAEFGAWKAGAIIAPLDPSLPPHELHELLARIEPRVLITLSHDYDRAKAAQSEVGIEHLIIASIKEHLPRGARLVFTMFREAREGHRARLASGDRWMSDLLEIYRGSFRPSLTIAPDDDATLMATAGTVDAPKLVLGTHRNSVASGFQLSAWFRDLAEPERDVIILPIPLFHVFGLCSVQALAMMARLPLALAGDHRDVADLLGMIQRIRPAFLAGVPSIFSAIAGHPLVIGNRVDLSSLKLCLSSAAPLLAETRARFEALSGCPVVQSYGLTESQGVNVVQPAGGVHKIGSAGMPLPDCAIRIRDRDAGRDLALGDIGEIWLKCPQLVRGYWRNSAETAAAIPASDGERWIRTGDLGYLDEEGYLFVVDRMSDLIAVGGFQVWPREIEEVIATLPGVVDVGVAAVPDDAGGQVARAWIVADRNRPVQERAIRDHCAKHLVGYKIPALITFCDALPRTAVGRLQRRRLVQLHMEEMAAASAGADARAERPVRLPAHVERLPGERVQRPRPIADTRPRT